MTSLFSSLLLSIFTIRCLVLVYRVHLTQKLWYCAWFCFTIFSHHKPIKATQSLFYCYEYFKLNLGKWDLSLPFLTTIYGVIQLFLLVNDSTTFISDRVPSRTWDELILQCFYQIHMLNSIEAKKSSLVLVSINRLQTFF